MLRRRLLAVFILVALMPIVILAAAFIVGAFSFTEKRSKDLLGGYLDTLSQLIDGELEAESLYLGSLAAELDNPYVSVPRTELGSWLLTHPLILSRFSQRPPVTSRFVLFDPEAGTSFGIEGRLTMERVILRGSPLEAERLPSWYALEWRDPRNARGGPRFARTIVRPTGPVIVLAVPLPQRDGSPPPVLAEELAAIPFLEHLLAQPAFQSLEGCFLAAPDEDRGVWSFLYHSDPSLIGLPLARDSASSGAAALFPQALSPASAIAVVRPVHAPGDRRAPQSEADRTAVIQAGAARTFARTGDRLSAQELHLSTGWLIGGSISLSPSLAPLRSYTAAALALIGLMAVLVTLGILLVTRGIGDAVEQIGEGVAAIAGGDLDRTIRVRRSDEFGAIATHVNEMARDLVITAEARSIARLSSRLVHDLKNVASQMNLLLYNLRENYDDHEFRAEFVTLMKQLVAQVESLALRLRRGGEDAAAAAQEDVDLDAFVRRIVERRARGHSPGIEVVLELSSEGAAFLSEELLGEIVENLVSNAVESMREGGTLRVRTGRLPARGRRRPRATTHFIEVEDTGPGMTREFIDGQLFRPFTTTKEKGLGLGMYQVREAVSRMGGEIEVVSDVGSGTRVRVEVGGKGPGSRA